MMLLENNFKKLNKFYVCVCVCVFCLLQKSINDSSEWRFFKTVFIGFIGVVVLVTGVVIFIDGLLFIFMLLLLTLLLNDLILLNTIELLRLTAGDSTVIELDGVNSLTGKGGFLLFINFKLFGISVDIFDLIITTNNSFKLEKEKKNSYFLNSKIYIKKKKKRSLH